MTATDRTPGGRRIGPAIAATLRYGTIAAVVVIGAGFGLALLDAAPGPGPVPVIGLIGHGGADALIAAGLLALTSIPALMLVVAAVRFAALGERRSLVVTLGVLALLAASIVAGALVGTAS